MMDGSGPVLLADSDGRCRSVIAATLRRASYRTIEAQSGHEVLSLVRTKRPALLLLQVELPGVSGYELCHELRHEYGDELPIIFLSETRTEPSDRVAGLLLGADDYVVKPFFQDELLARVRRLIDRTRPPATEKIGPVTNGARLTDREQQVLSLLAAGLHSKAIATRLVISPKTVATHIQRILAKLGVHSRAEAVALAFRSGLAQPIPESSLPTSAEEFSPAATTASG